MRLWRQLKAKGNPMFWPPVDGALLSCAMIIAMNLLFLGAGVIAQLFPAVAPHAQQSVLPIVNLFTLAVILLWSILFGLFWRQRKRNPLSRTPGLIVTYLFGHPLVVLAYFNGVHSIITGLLLAVTPAFGFVMSKNRHVMNAMLIIWAEIILLAFAVSLGWVADAPLFGDTAPNRFLTPIWVFMQVLLAFPVALGFLSFTRQIVSALRAREAQIRELSRRDALTGVWNRGYLGELMERELSLAARNGLPLSLIVADLDHFKRINDEHGHAAGDQALTNAARTLRECVRQIDHLGRYGGEEFVILLPNCDANAAATIAERCRQALAARPLVAEQGLISVTASFGVAGGLGDIDESALFREADLALYRAKENGRNRVEMADSVVMATAQPA